MLHQVHLDFTLLLLIINYLLLSVTELTHSVPLVLFTFTVNT